MDDGNSGKSAVNANEKEMPPSIKPSRAVIG